jgi:hypothetical protein
MDATNLPDYVVWLLEPSSYDYPVDEVQLIQTHISYVLIAGDYVYKYKKPVDFGFLDFTTLDKRAHYCTQELILNRRLCPDIYLDRVTVNAGSRGFELDGEGEVVEYGIKMARLNEEKMMGRIVAAGELERAHLDRIVETLVPFYESAAGDDAIRAYGLPDAVGFNVRENFEQTESFVGGSALNREQFDTIRSYAETALADVALFQGRIDAGRIRDCHGDLYSANICLDEPVHIFDCIEFNDRFRYSDVAGDIGFLAMDLDYHGLEDMAAYFVEHFAAASGDPTLLDVIDFYKCYRAYVRGKIGLFTAADPGLDQQAAAACSDQARRYFLLAERYASDASSFS